MGPDGILLTVADHPSEKHSPERRKKFINEAMLVYDGLCKRGFQDVSIAMVMYSDAFDEYELKYLTREVDPASHDDWLELREKVFAENFRRENEFYKRYRTPKARIGRIFKSKKKRVEVKTKGVLAVARIRRDSKEKSEDGGER